MGNEIKVQRAVIYADEWESVAAAINAPTGQLLIQRIVFTELGAICLV
jgi:uncharacterized membrane protein